MKATVKITYSEFPGVSMTLMSRIQPTLENCAIVAGNRMSELAKIGGMTPEVFTLRGRWVS